MMYLNMILYAQVDQKISVRNAMVEACTPNDMVGGMLNAAIVVPITMMMMIEFDQ